MPFYERGPVRIHYEEVGSGFPLLLIPGGGLNSALSSWQTASPFNPMERYKDDFRCICADLRNANPGQSSGPLEIDRPWDAYADDQLGLMDHLGIREFLVMGFCIGGPMIHNLIRRAPERVVAAAMMQPSGFRPELPDVLPEQHQGLGAAALCEKRPDVTMDMVHDFLTSMYTNRADFVFTVSRDFVRSIQTPLLIAPDDVPAHPYKVAMEVASLAPNAEVTIYPWKDSQEHIDEVVEHAGASSRRTSRLSQDADCRGGLELGRYLEGLGGLGFLLGLRLHALVQDVEQRDQGVQTQSHRRVDERQPDGNRVEDDADAGPRRRHTKLLAGQRRPPEARVHRPQPQQPECHCHRQHHGAIGCDRNVAISGRADVGGYERRWEGNDDDGGEQEQIEKQEEAVEACQIAQKRVVVHPNDADQGEADQEAGISRPLMSQGFCEMAVGIGRYFQVKDQERHGDGKNTIAEGFHSSPFHCPPPIV